VIRILLIKENKDGSADVSVRFDKEGHHLLLQYGLTSILEKAIEERDREDGFQSILDVLSEKNWQANSKKKLGKAVGRKQTKGIRSNRTAPKILGKKRN
jgi:hypothetical protein